MILNTLIHGIVAAIMCFFMLFVAWKAVHENKNDPTTNIIAVLLAMLGSVLGLLAFNWISTGL